MTALPELTTEQREAGLARAAEARRERRALLDQLADDPAALGEVLRRTDNVARKTRVADLIRALPGYGPTRTARVLADVGIDGKRRVGSLGSRQRDALADAVS